jgi:hypothetical protein
VAVLMVMTWDGVTVEQYEAARRVVNWEGDVPPGGMVHVAAIEDGRLHVTDVWESPEELDAFVQSRLMPGVQQVGIQGQPEISVYPVHALFTPAFQPA